MELLTFGPRHALIKLQHPLRRFPLDSIMFDAINHEINCFALALCFFSHILPSSHLLAQVIFQNVIFDTIVNLEALDLQTTICKINFF